MPKENRKSAGLARAVTGLRCAAAVTPDYCCLWFGRNLRYALEKFGLRWGLELPTILEAYLANEVALKRYLSRFIKSREAADDLAQEAFIRAFAAEGARVIESPKAFLFKVAKNLALNELARLSANATQPLGDFEDQEVLEDSSQAAVEDVVDSRERVRLLARAIAALPPQCAKVFILRKMQGLSQKEIAVRLNISVRTVENHVATGLSRCRAYMREHGGVAGVGSERIQAAFVKAQKAE